MSKKELKLQNKDLEINIVDILTDIDPSETGKYTQFLIKNLRKFLEVERLSPRKMRVLRGNHEYVIPRSENHLENIIINYLTGEIFGVDKLETLAKFNNHLENHRIPVDRRDINSYEDWSAVERENSIATIKHDQKRLEKEVIKVLETDEWLVIKPLTMESSLTYGAGTKWCTAMKNNKEYFYRYSNNGVLTYAINKNTGDKYGVFYDIHNNNKEFSIWNAPDQRIDSIESTIPSIIMKEIYNLARHSDTNFSLFSKDEKLKANRYIDNNKYEQVLTVSDEISEEISDDRAAYYENSGEVMNDSDCDVESVDESLSIVVSDWANRLDISRDPWTVGEIVEEIREQSEENGRRT